MASPRRRFPRYDGTEEGIGLRTWNDMLAGVEKLDNVAGGFGYRGPAADATLMGREAKFLLIEMDGPLGPEESSDFQHGSGNVVYYDPDQNKWIRGTRPISILADPFKHHAIGDGERVMCAYMQQAKKYVPINPSCFRLLQTCEDYLGNYPTPFDCPNVYPFVHLQNVSFTKPILNWTSVLATGVMPGGAGGPPHGGELGADDTTGYVFNLAGGGEEDETYIPEGTVICAWFLDGNWYTYWVGVFTCGYSSASSGGSSASSAGSSTSSGGSSASSVSSTSSGGSSTSSSTSSTSSGGSSTSSSTSSTSSTTSSTSSPSSGGSSASSSPSSRGSSASSSVSSSGGSSWSSSISVSPSSQGSSLSSRGESSQGSSLSSRGESSQGSSLSSIGYSSSRGSSLSSQGVSSSAATVVRVVTDVYCDDEDIVVCTRDLHFDGGGHLTWVSDEVCG